MKPFCIFLIIFPFLCFGATLEIIGPCFPEPLLTVERNADKNQSVGDFTISVLEENEVPHLGTSAGINSIFDTPVGLEALEVISDGEMRAYGWCYQIDGHEPNAFPDKVYLNHANSLVKWFFGFAHFKNGEWISQCTQASEIAPDFLCQ